MDRLLSFNFSMFTVYQAVALKICKVPHLVLGRSAGPRKLGGGIGLWGSTLKALRTLGIESSLVGSPLVCAGYRTVKQINQNKWLVKPSEILDRHTSCLCLRRHELLSKLTAAVSPCCIRYERNVISLKRLPDQSVLLTLDNGQVVRGSAVVGADGIQSNIRKTIFPEVEVKPCGYYYWLGVSMGLDGDPPPPAYEAWHHGLRFGMVPLAGRESFWFLCSNEDISMDSTGGQLVTDQSVSKIEDVVSRLSNSCQQLLDKTSPNQIF